jgi:hypothetical protein
MNQALRDFGKRFAAKKGIQPIRAGETRPVGFYMLNHTTGKPIILDQNAVVLDQSKAAIREANGSTVRGPRSKDCTS